jgi:hypothetical protein
MKTKTARILALAGFVAGSAVIFSKCPPRVQSHFSGTIAAASIDLR